MRKFQNIVYSLATSLLKRVESAWLQSETLFKFSKIGRDYYNSLKVIKDEGRKVITNILNKLKRDIRFLYIWLQFVLKLSIFYSYPNKVIQQRKKLLLENHQVFDDKEEDDSGKLIINSVHNYLKLYHQNTFVHALIYLVPK